MGSGSMGSGSMGSGSMGSGSMGSGTSAGGADDYDNVRPAYQLGHLAGRNPDYASRSFDEVEPDLQRGWTSDVASRHGEWHSVRGYARDAFDRGRMGSASSASVGGVGSTASGTAGHTGHGITDKIRNAVDDVKDRVDGNPASRPGPDPTDRRF